MVRYSFVPGEPRRYSALNHFPGNVSVCSRFIVEAKAKLDLYTPQVEPDKFHAGYRAAYQHFGPNRWKELHRWADGFVDRDNKFVKEFQTSFDSSFWELYLWAVLKEYGMTVDFSHATPDFVVTSPTEMVVEATVASNAQGQPGSAYNPMEAPIPDDLHEYNRQSILRLANGINSKTKKYRAKYSSLKHVQGKPFVIAIAPFDRPHFTMQCNRAIEALLYGIYVDEQEFVDDPKHDFPPPSVLIDSVVKTNGADVPLAIFADDSHSDISAVIFSTLATWSKVGALAEDDENETTIYQALRYNPNSHKPHYYRLGKSEHAEVICDGLRIYHNPFASLPIDDTVFRRPEVFQLIPDHENEALIADIREYQLVWRQARTTRKVRAAE